MAASKSRYLKRLHPVLVQELGAQRAGSIIARAQTILKQLCAENADEPMAMHMHTRARIYPAIAAFQAMLQEGVERNAAADILNAYYVKQSEAAGAAIRAILRIPGLYRRVPRFFARMTRKSFGEAAGFKAKWIRADQDEMRFDMMVCPYQDICVRYGCSEIVQGFCRADDVSYGNMHPKLRWGRTKTLGLEGDCCDFQITIRKQHR